MRFHITLLTFLTASLICLSQENKTLLQEPGYEKRIRDYVDNLRIVDTHEHLFSPDQLKKSPLLDFSIFFQPYGIDGLIISGMPDSLFRKIYNDNITTEEKWNIIEPYWGKSFNITSNRIILIAIKDLYNISELNRSTYQILSDQMRKAYAGDWFNHVLRDLCKIDYVIDDWENIGPRYNYLRYAKRFTPWILVKSKFQVDSLAVMQTEPIYTLEDFVKSMSYSLEKAYNQGMVAVKVNVAYKRSLSFDKVTEDAARKVFRTLVNGNEDFVLPQKDAKTLQDYMLRKLLALAQQHDIPVCFHTGLQSGGPNVITNSDPLLLTNLFFEYPDLRFILFHGSYPFGGELSTLGRNFKNVYLDLNWTYSISPEYAGRYLSEWLEVVPVSKILAFGGDQRLVENTYGSLVLARKIISEVLAEKVRNGLLTEAEALTVARMILHDNPVQVYNLR